MIARNARHKSLLLKCAPFSGSLKRGDSFCKNKRDSSVIQDNFNVEMGTVWNCGNFVMDSLIVETTKMKGIVKPFNKNFHLNINRSCIKCQTPDILRRTFIARILVQCLLFSFLHCKGTLRCADTLEHNIGEMCRYIFTTSFFNHVYI